MDNYINSANNEWQTLSDPVLKSRDSENIEAQEEFTSDVKTYKNRLLAPVLTFQLILCLLILTFAFLCKNIFPDFFTNIDEAYDKEISSSLIPSGEFFGLDYSHFFGATDDEI